VQQHVQLDPLVILGDQLGAHPALDRRQLLTGDDTLGELHEMVVDRALGDPYSGVSQQPATTPPDREGEGPQGDLGRQRTTLENDELGPGRDRKPGRSHPYIVQHGA
jgi:hypothetical protein